MRVSTSIVLDRDDINDILPYTLICMTRYGAAWNRQVRMERWDREFTEDERHEAETIFRQSHRWLIVSGTPDETRMTGSTLALWLKLGKFCASI